MAMEESPVSEWFTNKVIFITGGSGFMGKVMLEKLLYSCTGLKRIYMLVRSKRGKSPKQRFEEMWKLPLFERLRNSQPSAIEKIIPLVGELHLENFGLKESEIELLANECNIFLHMGATLKLEAKLNDAVAQNTGGTLTAVEIAKKMKKLDAFLYFSTAFCSADIDVFEEKVYETKDNPMNVIEVSKWMNAKALEDATLSIIQPHPNTYTYSKRLGETIVGKQEGKLPVCIVRPAIVIPSVKEPLKGWVDNLNGPIGLLVAGGKGVLRSTYASGENICQIIPVDYAINASICIAYLVGSKQTGLSGVPVYNLTTSSILQITNKEVLALGRNIVLENPFEMQVWYPDGDIRSSKFVHNLYSLFYHWLPALLIDFLMIIFRQKPFMWRIQKKIYDGLELLEFFNVRKWNFKNDNFTSIPYKLTETDRKKFPMIDVPDINEYFKNAVLGTRQYCLKEDLSSLPRCRRKQKVLYVIHKVCVYGFYYYMLVVLSTIFPPVKIALDGVKTALSYLPVIGNFLSR